MSGCENGNRANSISEGSVPAIEAKLGLPDLISEEAGDTVRYYRPANRPESQWPAAFCKYYYLNRNIVAEFRNGKFVGERALSESEVQQVSNVLKTLPKNR